MPTKQTQLPPPPVRDTSLSRSEQLYLATLQYQLPLRASDSSSGPYSEALPSPGLVGNTGQTNQNQELIFVKVSADANIITITGAANGPQQMQVQYDKLRFKSDGTKWYAV